MYFVLSKRADVKPVEPEVRQMSLKGIDVLNTKTGTTSYGIEVKDAQDNTSDTRRICTLQGALHNKING